MFLLLGMPLGEDGPGGIALNDVDTAFLVASLALAAIPFDGGLHRPAAASGSGRPAPALATVGVAITLRGSPARPPSRCSTSAWPTACSSGAIWWARRQRRGGVLPATRARVSRINDRLQATLEIESGGDDPMAVFLTVALDRALVRAGGVGEADALGLVTAFVCAHRRRRRDLGALAAGSCLPARSTRLASRKQLDPVLVPAAGLAGSSASRARSAAAPPSAACAASVVAGNAMRRARPRRSAAFTTAWRGCARLGCSLAGPARDPE
ncbi:MAG: hypothetical protein U5K43_00395 [Halofilum sp. (in: g-proteobacteria)]|nr:hypothetical protein [Halofilum sp. (in: g-proteobacteria)]